MKFPVRLAHVTNSVSGLCNCCGRPRPLMSIQVFLSTGLADPAATAACTAPAKAWGKLARTAATSTCGCCIARSAVLVVPVLVGTLLQPSWLKPVSLTLLSAGFLALCTRCNQLYQP
eukprot:1836412-Amphidinium_carterae.2